MYVAMLISVTKASMYFCRDRRRCTDQSGGIYDSDSTVARDLWQRKPPLSSGFALGLRSVYCHTAMVTAVLGFIEQVGSMIMEFQNTIPSSFKELA